MNDKQEPFYKSAEFWYAILLGPYSLLIFARRRDTDWVAWRRGVATVLIVLVVGCSIRLLIMMLRGEL